MKFSYLLAVSSGRIVTLLLMLALSHILAGSEFGRYSILAINALLFHSLMGSWLAMAATQALATGDGKNIDATLAKILKIAGWIALFQCLLALSAVIVSAMTGFEFGLSEILAMLSFALVMLAFDVVTAAKNALGDDSLYLRFNLLRNLGGGTLALFFAWLSNQGVLAIVGQTLGIILAFILSASALKKWKPAIASLRITQLRRQDWRSMIAFGLTGSLALSLLIFVNSLIRNLAFWLYGEDVAGTFALITDFFYAPLVLLGTSYSLSKMRQLYQLNQAAHDERLMQHKRFNGTIGFLIIPYAVGGYLTAPYIAALLVPSQMLSTAVSIAGMSAVQAATLSIVSTVVTILLTSGLKRKVFSTVAYTLLCIAISCLAGTVLQGASQFAAAILVGSVVAATISIAILGTSAFPWTELAKTVIASIAMAVIIIPAIGMDSIFGLPLAIIGGATSFAVFTLILRISLWRDLIPEAMVAANPDVGTETKALR